MESLPILMPVKKKTVNASEAKKMMMKPRTDARRLSKRERDAKLQAGGCQLRQVLRKHASQTDPRTNARTKSTRTRDDGVILTVSTQQSSELSLLYSSYQLQEQPYLPTHKSAFRASPCTPYSICGYQDWKVSNHIATQPPPRQVICSGYGFDVSDPCSISSKGSLDNASHVLLRRETQPTYREADFHCKVGHRDFTVNSGGTWG